jgi:hypothetical protein
MKTELRETFMTCLRLKVLVIKFIKRINLLYQEKGHQNEPRTKKNYIFREFNFWEVN